MIKKIDIGINKIEYVYHIADIHIRNIKRHEEYNLVFDKFFENIKKDNKPNSIIAILGDIIHSKSEISPELVKEVSVFLKNCGDLYPTIVITGNHDCNLNNMDRLDSLSPIINNLNHKNVHYLKNSGVYLISDLIFTVMSVFDKPEKFIKSSQIKTTKKKIALFHGPVSQAKTDIGHIITGNNYPLDLFNGFDAVMLGDIHKRQILKDKDPTIIYPGSMLQQNHSETIDNHGYCLWNMTDLSYSFVDIKNDYGFYTIEINDGKLTTDVTNLPKKIRLRVKCLNTIPSEVKSIVSKLGKTTEILDLVYLNGSFFSDNKTTDKFEKINLDEITSVDFQNKLIKKYVEENFPDSISEIEDVYKLNKKINDSIVKEETLIKNNKWKPKKLEWSNLFSYGENNIIDFSKMRDIFGIFGKNVSGKTSVIDVLNVCLFDRSFRSKKAVNFMNTSKMSFSCKFTFEINGVDYCIERNGKRNKKGDVKVDVDFYKWKDKEKINLNEEQRRGTNEVINDYVGTYEDFILTTLYLQNNNSNFIDKGQTERKDLLSQFMGLNIFDKLFEIADTEIKEISTLTKKINKSSFTHSLVQLEGELSKTQLLLNSFELKKFNLEQQYDLLNEKFLFETKKLKNIDTNIITDIPHEEDKLKNIIEEETKSKLIFEEEKKNLIVLNNSKKLIENNLKKIDSKNISFKYEEYQKKLTEQTKLSSKINIIKNNITNKLKKLEHLSEHEYDENCKYCMNNIFVKDAIQTKETLESDKIDLDNINKEFFSVENYIKENSKVLSDHNNIKKLNISLNEIESQCLKKERYIQTIKEKIFSLETNRKLIIDNIDKAKIFKESIENNISVNTSILDIKNKISSCNKEIKDITSSIISYSSKILSMKSKIDDINNNIKEASELEHVYNIYNIYLECVKRDGIPYQLISKTVPTIENEINNILSQIVDFGVILQMEGKNINSYIVYEDKIWPMEMSSGAERFITSIAIRVALTNISNLPKPSFLIIDEGLGCLDSENMPSMNNLFTYLKSKFEFVIIISHIDIVKDMVDNSIEIKKDKGFSFINYS